MEKLKVRKSAAAGRFYQASAFDLRGQIESFLDKKAERSDVIACMLPHAGYTYSGRVAVQTVSRINIKDRVILIGPNHTGHGPAFSIMSQGVWQTPLGDVKVDSVLAGKILASSEYLEDDFDAHRDEHSLEVELPILQYFKKTLQIVPICLASHDVYALKKIAEAIAGAIKESNLESSALIIASSDMTHYESQDQADKKDKQAIQAILELDADKFTAAVQGLNISMCGYAPALVMLASSKLLGAKKAELIKYQTSGDITGDYDRVVGYAGIVIY
ncbi:MAG: AmmeMemoRadiSam system protein B [Candidatus Omnitrophota bacterium]